MRINATLSNAERRIANFVAKTAMSNKEMAEKLFVTEKTIKFHLTNIYKKTKCRSRADLKQQYYDRKPIFYALEGEDILPNPPETLSPEFLTDSEECKAPGDTLKEVTNENQLAAGSKINMNIKVQLMRVADALAEIAVKM